MEVHQEEDESEDRGESASWLSGQTNSNSHSQSQTTGQSKSKSECADYPGLFLGIRIYSLTKRWLFTYFRKLSIKMQVQMKNIFYKKVFVFLHSP